MVAYGIVDSRGKLMNDFMGRIGFTTKKRANEVNKAWQGTVVKLEIKIK